MPEDITPANAESVKIEADHVPDFRESFDAALAEHGLDADSQESGAEPKEAPASKEPEKAADEPEYLTWARSVEGNFDKESGQFNVDRIVKQAFELNKQYQPTAQELAKFRQAFQHPRIQAVLQELVSGKAPESAKKPTQEDEYVEKTDRQIFDEMVDKRSEAKYEERIKPIQEKLDKFEKVYAAHINGEMRSAYTQLQETFGKEVYSDAFDAEVGQHLATEAARAGVDWNQLKVTLAENGTLFKVFHTAATNLLYPKLVAKLSESQKAKSDAELAKQKGAQLPTRGTSARNVKEKTPEVNSFQDAVRLAEEQLRAGVA